MGFDPCACTWAEGARTEKEKLNNYMVQASKDVFLAYAKYCNEVILQSLLFSHHMVPIVVYYSTESYLSWFVLTGSMQSGWGPQNWHCRLLLVGILHRHIFKVLDKKLAHLTRNLYLVWNIYLVLK